MSKTRSRRAYGALLASYCIAAAGAAWWSHAAQDSPPALSDGDSDAERAFRRPLLADELPPDAYRRPLLADVDPRDIGSSPLDAEVPLHRETSSWI